MSEERATYNTRRGDEVVRTREQAKRLLREIRIDLERIRYGNRQEKQDLQVFIDELIAFIERNELPAGRRNSEVYLWLVGSKSATLGSDYGVE